MNHDPESFRRRAIELLGQGAGINSPELLENIEKLIEEYNIHKIELELQQDELARTNQELEFKNRQLDELFENAPVGYFILTSKGIVEEVNNTACSMLGISREYISGKPFTRLIHASSQDHYYFFWHRMLGREEVGNLEVMLGNGDKNPLYFLLNGQPFLNKGTNQWQVRLSATNVSEIKEAEALRDSERRYRLLFKNMINGLLVLKPVFKKEELVDFRFFRANAAFEQMTGLVIKTLEGASFLHIFPDKGKDILPMLHQTVLLNNNQKIENLTLNDDISVNFHSFIPEEGYVALIIEDVTAQMKARQESKLSEELLRTIFKILPVGVTITDKNGQITDCNQASEELLGLKKEDHLVRNVAGHDWKIIRPDLTNMPPDEYASVKALRENRIIENVEMGIVKSQNEITWINVSAAPIPLHEMGVAIVYSDITERVQAQEETEEKFKNIIQNSTDAIIIVNQSGAIIEWNKGCELIFGYRRKRVLGQRIWAFIGKILINDSINEKHILFNRENIEIALRSGESEWFLKISEMQIKDASNNTKTLQSVAFPVKSAHGYLLGVIARDITESKQAENLLKVAKEKAEEASFIKSQFLANISHEIRTPLNAIMGFTEILKEFPLTDNKFKSHLNGIEKSSKALMALINDILDLSRIEAGKMSLNPTSFSIKTMVEDVKQIFSLKADQKGLTLQSIIDPATPESIYLDELRLRQILFNLVGNAVKFTEKGSIKIIVSAIRKPLVSNMSSLNIRVIDTGPGIIENDLEVIFDPFFQKQPPGAAKNEGTGLGLAISRRFADMMQGKISVESKPGVGTEFLLYLPNVPVTEWTLKPGKARKKESPTKNLTGSLSIDELTQLVFQELKNCFGSSEKAHEFLNQEIWVEYDKIADILGFDEVISFSVLLNDIARKNKLTLLEQFAAILSHEATSFNVIEINRMLSSFETLRKP